MNLERLLENPVRILFFVVTMALALVAGLLVAQGFIFQVLTIALLLTVVWIFYFLQRPAHALIALICLKAMMDRVNYVIAGPLTINSLLYCVVLGGGLIYFTLNSAQFRHNGASLTFVAFVLYTVPLAVLAPARADGIALWVREAAMGVLYFLLVNLMERRKDQQLYIGLVGAVAMLGVALSFAQKAGLYAHANSERFSGTFGHPNFFAYFLLMPTSLASCFLMLSSSWRVRAACAVIIGLCVAGLVLTFCRGAWIAGIAMFILLGLLGRKWFIVVSLGLVVSLYALMPSIQQKLYWLIDQPNLNAASSGRMTVWSENIPLIRDRPIVGFGLNSYIYYSPRHGDAHNSYLKLLFETGVIGLTIYCVFFVLNAVYAFRVWRHSSDGFERMLALGCFCFFIAFMIGGLWENLFLGQGTEWFSFSLAAIVAGNAKRLETQSAPAPPQTAA